MFSRPIEGVVIVTAGLPPAVNVKALRPPAQSQGNPVIATFVSESVGLDESVDATIVLSDELPLPLEAARFENASVPEHEPPMTSSAPMEKLDDAAITGPTTALWKPCTDSTTTTDAKDVKATPDIARLFEQEPERLTSVPTATKLDATRFERVTAPLLMALRLARPPERLMLGCVAVIDSAGTVTAAQLDTVRKVAIEELMAPTCSSAMKKEAQPATRIGFGPRDANPPTVTASNEKMPTLAPLKMFPSDEFANASAGAVRAKPVNTFAPDVAE